MDAYVGLRGHYKKSLIVGEQRSFVSISTCCHIVAWGKSVWGKTQNVTGVAQESKTFRRIVLHCYLKYTLLNCILCLFI